MNKISHILFSLLFILSACSSYKKKPSALDQIVESFSIQDIYSYLTSADYHKNTLVIFDIDNTIGHPPTDLGSDQWFYAMLNRAIKQGIPQQKAIDDLIPIYYQLMEVMLLEPTEPAVVPLIKDLQNKKISVISLTARSLGITERTIVQLHGMDINFSLNMPRTFPIAYEKGKGAPALYIDGIIFVGNHDKGEVLAHWLKQTKFKPTKIIFIDDKLKNVKDVEKALHKRNYPFIGIRYGKIDERVKNFDIEATDREYEQFMQQYPESRPIPLHIG